MSDLRQQPILVFGTNLNATQVKCTSGNSDIEVCVCVFWLNTVSSLSGMSGNGCSLCLALWRWKAQSRLQTASFTLSSRWLLRVCCTRSIYLSTRYCWHRTLSTPIQNNGKRTNRASVYTSRDVQSIKRALCFPTILYKVVSERNFRRIAVWAEKCEFKQHRVYKA